MEPKQQGGEAVYDFSGFRLDPDRRLLFVADGRQIPIKPKVFDTLLYFVEHSGDLLDKSTLMRAIWRGVIVDENGLQQHVSMLRRVLGERPGDNRFIATVPGRGYRFVANVTRPSADARAGDAWRYMTKSLGVTTPNEREVVLSRLIAAPRERVYEAWTTPEWLRRWYCVGGWSMVVCELDLREGRPWRFVTRHEDGTEVVQRGVLLEVVPSERLVQTEYWENPDIGEMQVTITFSTDHDKTVLQVTVRFSTNKGRDGFLASGLLRDIASVYDRLARFVEATPT